MTAILFRMLEMHTNFLYKLFSINHCLKIQIMFLYFETGGLIAAKELCAGFTYIFLFYL